MLPLHCQNCGRLIGRAEKATFEGKTVCLRCLRKLDPTHDQPDAKGLTRTAIMVAIITAVVGGGLLYGIIRLVKAATE